MTDAPWISTALADVRLVGKFDTDIWEDRRDLAIEASRLNDDGLPVPPEMCPNKIWGDDLAPFFKKIPDLISAQAHWIVSARAADVLGRFDLGGGALYPVREGVYQKDRATRVAGEFFCWIFGNSKSAFAPEQTPRKRPFGVAGLSWKMPLMLVDGEIAVDSRALAGADVWVDPQLFQSLFLSGSLGDALSTAGLGEAFRLRRCTLV